MVGRTRKKRKTKQQKVRTEPSKIVTLVTGVALAIGSAGYFLSKNNPAQNSSTYRQTAVRERTVPKSELEEYASSVEQAGNDPEKRNLYIIFQVHGCSGRPYSEKVVKGHRRKMSEVKTNIYYLTDILYRKAGVQVVAHEGFTLDFNKDINDPNVFLRKQMEYNGLSKEDILNLAKDQRKFQSFMGLSRMSGAILLGFLHKDLFLVGWERGKESSELDEVVNERIYLGILKNVLEKTALRQLGG